MDAKINNKLNSRFDFQITHERGIKSKRSQVTIFIIIGILLIAGIIIFFAVRGKINLPGATGKLPDFQSEMEKCVSDNVGNAVDIMLPQAGYINPDNYYLYKDMKIQYLCYNKNFYYTCVNQEPMYLELLKKEIKTYISGKIEDCFYSLKQEYEAKGYVVNMGETKLGIGLNPRQVNVIINKIMELTKNDEVKRYTRFDVKISSPIYDLGIIAQEIVNQEAKYCYFDYLGFSLAYPDFEITRTDINGQVKIYSIEEISSGKTLWIATRSCAMPPGL